MSKKEEVFYKKIEAVAGDIVGLLDDMEEKADTGNNKAYLLNIFASLIHFHTEDALDRLKNGQDPLMRIETGETMERLMAAYKRFLQDAKKGSDIAFKQQMLSLGPRLKRLQTLLKQEQNFFI